MRSVVLLALAFVVCAPRFAAAQKYTGSGIDNGGVATAVMGGSLGDFRGQAATSREAAVVITSAPASIRYDKLHFVTAPFDFSATKRFQVGNTLQTRLITCTVHIDPVTLDFKTPYSSPLIYSGDTSFHTNFPVATEMEMLKQKGTGKLTIAGPSHTFIRNFTLDFSVGINQPLSELDTIGLPLFAKLQGPFFDRYGNNPTLFSGVVDGVSVSVDFQAMLVEGGPLTFPVQTVPEPSALGVLALGGLAALRRRLRH